MDTRLTLLGLVGSGSEYGYDLKQNYDYYFTTTKPLAFGQVYATLSRLLRDGLITTIGAESGDGPERKRYEITPTGRDTIQNWMREPEDPTAQVRSNIFAKTIIALLLGDDADALLDLQKQAHLKKMSEITRSKRNADVSTVILADYLLAHLDADLTWMDLTAARINELQAEIAHRNEQETK
ncbi:MAG: PadR family transcriptional regulator [Trueperella sp.]|nr:PadR family transcriptional regulator [Trueperella sp.]